MASNDKSPQDVDLSDQSLIVEISDALSEKDKVKFTIHTKTTLSNFKSSDFTVVRDHDEFIWLHDTFATNDKIIGVLIPPPPPSPDFEEPCYKLQRLSENEAAYTKEEKQRLKAEIETEYLALFKRTVSLHEAFLRRLSNHPKLRNDHNFHVFLEFDKDLELRNKNTKERLNILVKGFSKSFDENIALRDHKDVDNYFDQEKQFYTRYHNNLLACSRSSRRAAQLQRSCASATMQVAYTTKNLSSVEYSDCNKIIEKFGESLEKYRKIEDRSGSDMELKLADFLEYYSAETQSALDLLFRRIQSLVAVEKSNKNLDSARSRNKDIIGAETSQEKFKERFDEISELSKAELIEFKERRVEAYKRYFSELAELQIKHTKTKIKILTDCMRVCQEL